MNFVTASINDLTVSRKIIYIVVAWVRTVKNGLGRHLLTVAKTLRRPALVGFSGSLQILPNFI
jgi:hypothetical protein